MSPDPDGVSGSQHRDSRGQHRLSDGDRRAGGRHTVSVRGDDSAFDIPRAMPPSTLRRRLNVLLLSRLVVATLLFGGTLLFAIDGARGMTAFTPVALIAATIAMFAATGMFAAQLMTGRASLRLITIEQIAFDLCLASVLVYVSGAAGSVFTVLYGIVVLYTAMTLGPAGSRFVAGISIVVYAGLGYAVATGALPAPPDQAARPYELQATELGFALFSNTVALIVVGALASYLSGRLLSAGGRIERAEARVLHLAQRNFDIVRSMSSGLLTIDLADRIVQANPAAAAMFGVEPPALEGELVGAFMQLEDEARGEVDAVRPDGSNFPIGYSKTPLRNTDGEVEGSLVVFADLTEVQALRVEADRAQRLALLGGVAAALAHEIRNPLGSISGSVQMVAESSELDEDDRQLLGIISTEVDRLNQLVTTMLDIGRPSIPRPGATNITAVARDVAAVAAQDETLQRAHIELVCPDAELVAHVDPDRLRQLLWNLLKNAVQASPQNGRVEIRIQAEGEGVELLVSDAGPGVPEADRPRLFEMFFSKRSLGMGMGLALAKQIVDAHSGTITVGDSELGGAAFRVWLPKEPPHRRPTPASTAALPTH